MAKAKGRHKKVKYLHKKIITNHHRTTSEFFITLSLIVAYL